MHDDLTTFAVRYGTDKFGYHDYTPNYHAMFARFRHLPVRVLEIGVGGYGDPELGGESLSTWAEYFPLGRIIGIDIQKKTMDLGPRVRICQGSQVDAEFLARIVQEEGPFDLIIDDGSHQNEHVIESFRLLFPTLAPGGVYAVEDTQTAFFPRYGGGPELTQPNSIGFFAQILRRFLGGAEGPDVTDVPAEGLCAIERFHNIVALHKAGPKGSAVPVSWLAEPPESERAALANVTRLAKGDAPGLTSAKLTAAFDATPEGSALVVDRAAVSQEVTDFLVARFVEVDHMEQRIHFPHVPLHPMADTLRALTVTGESVALLHAPNRYPSNFAYDPTEPQAARALARMEEILGDGKPWPGAIGLAKLKLRFGQAEDAGALLTRFGDGAGQPRTFFHMANSTLSALGQTEQVREILEQGVAQHPDDIRLLGMLAALRHKDGALDEAEALLHKALQKAPRDRVLLWRMGHVQLALGKFAEAAESTEAAIKVTPLQARDSQRLFLAQIRMRQGLKEAALAILSEMTAEDGTQNTRALRLMSQVQFEIGKTEAALAYIDRALAIQPDNDAYRRFRQRIAL